MKKLLAGLLVSSMVLSMVGCGGKNEPAETKSAEVKTEAATTAAVTAAEPTQETVAEKTKLKIMVWGSLDGKYAEWNDILALNPEMAAKYEIELISGGANEGECMEKVRLALISGENLCDLMALNYINVPELAEAGALYDLSDAIAPYEDKMVDGAKELSQYKGQTVAVPSQLKSLIWYYRKDIFDECGIDAAQVKTTDDFIAAGKKIQEKYPDAYLMNLGPDPNDSFYYYILSGNGASFFDEDGNYNLSTNQGVIDCLTDVKKLADSGICMDVTDWTPDWENAFANDNLISCLSATWMADPYIPTYTGGDDAGKWSTALWPSIGGATGGSDMAGSVYVVPTFSSCPEEAAEFISWYHLSETGETKFYDFYSTMAYIVNKDVLSADFVVENANPYFDEAFVQTQIDAAEAFKVFNFGPNSGMEKTIVGEYFDKAVLGEMSIEDALKAAEEALNLQIGNAYNN